MHGEGHGHGLPLSQSEPIAPGFTSPEQVQARRLKILRTLEREAEENIRAGAEIQRNATSRRDAIRAAINALEEVGP